MLSTASCLVSERCIVCSMDLHVHVVPAILGCASLVLAYYVPKIKTPSAKKWMSTLVGLVYILGLAGLWGTLDLLLMVVVNAGIIVWGNKRYCFSLSFCYSFAQLTLFNHEEIFPGFGRQRELAFLLMMAMLWKMIHLAGEVQDTFLSELNDKKPRDSRMKVYTALSYSDVFHFGFCYVGVITFFRYRTYYDWLHYSFYVHSKRFGLILRRAKDLATLAAVCGATSLFWSLDYIIVWDEYIQQDFSTRLFYATYCGLGTYLLIYAFFVLVEILTMGSGMGAYPSATNPKPGRGPTKRLELLDELVANPKLAQFQEYNFETTRNIYIMDATTAPTFRVFWQKYNVSIQYVLAVNVYKRFPFQQYRLFATFFISALWHGLFAGRFVAMFCFLVYLTAEEILYDRYRRSATGVKGKLLGALFWASHFFLHAHIFFAIVFLKRADLVYRFLASIWFLPIIYPLVMLAVALCLLSFYFFSRQIFHHLSIRYAKRM